MFDVIVTFNDGMFLGLVFGIHMGLWLAEVMIRKM